MATNDSLKKSQRGPVVDVLFLHVGTPKETKDTVYETQYLQEVVCF